MITYFHNKRLLLEGNSTDLAHALVVLEDLSLIVVGSTESTNTIFGNNHGNRDIFIARWHPVVE